MLSREQNVSNAFVSLAGTLVSGFDLDELLLRLSSTCVDLLDVDAAGILIADAAGRLRVIGASDAKLRILELFEVQVDEGPCVDCFATGAPVSAGHLEDDARWPAFSPRAVAAGYASVDAVPLRLRGRTLGALNLFRASATPLSGPEQALAQAFADVATIGLMQARLLEEQQLLAEQLQAALASRVVLEQAKGVLAEQGGVSVEDAFASMRSYARPRNVALSDVAEAVVEGRLTYATLTG